MPDVRIVPDPLGAPTRDLRQSNGRLDIIVGTARDARAVGMQVGDLLVHMTPDEAREIIRALEVSARAVEMLLRDPTLRIDGRAFDG